MKKDIQNRNDIRTLIDNFYSKVIVDPVIGYFFNDVAKVNWEHHLPIMYDFWESILFQATNYKGNPMIAHVNLHKKSPLSPEHFARWQSLFLATVDEYFQGEVAERAKQRARSIAVMIQVKVIS